VARVLRFQRILPGADDDVIAFAAYPYWHGLWRTIGHERRQVSEVGAVDELLHLWGQWDRHGYSLSADSRQTVDQGRYISRAKSIVYIYHADVRRAGVEHAEQCRHPFERCAVAHAGGHGDDWNADQSSHDAGQSAFHAGANDDDTGSRQRFAIGKQAMNAGDSDVVEVFDFIAHDFGGYDGFFRDGDVTGSGGDHGDDSLAIFLRIALQNDSAGEVAIFDGANFFLYGGKLFFAGARGQDVATVLGETGKNSCHLRRRLAFSEDDLGHAIAQGAVVIDFGETEIFKRQMAQAGDGIVGREFAVADLLEKLADGFGVHGNSAASAQHPPG
jgi:hypothetical protein